MCDCYDAQIKYDSLMGQNAHESMEFYLYNAFLLSYFKLKRSLSLA